MATIHFVLGGRTPLLMHSQRAMRANSDTKTTRKKIPTPEEEAEQGAYRLADGSLGVLAVAVRNALLSGAKGKRIRNKAAQPIVAGAVLPLQHMLLFPLLSAEGTPLRDYTIDVQRAVVRQQGVMRARPLIPPPWFVVCAFEFDNSMLHPNVIEELLVDAGRTVGLGDYRVEKRGWYGCFVPQEVRVEE